MIIAIKYLLCTLYRIKVLDIRDIRHHIALTIFRIGACTFYSFKITIRNLKFLTFESQLLDNVVGGSGREQWWSRQAYFNLLRGRSTRSQTYLHKFLQIVWLRVEISSL